MSIDVCSEVRCYERNGKRLEAREYLDGPKLHVRSHWNESSKVVLEFEDVRITVVAGDLVAAVHNAQNRGAR